MFRFKGLAAAAFPVQCAGTYRDVEVRVGPRKVERSGTFPNTTIAALQAKIEAAERFQRRHRLPLPSDLQLERGETCRR